MREVGRSWAGLGWPKFGETVVTVITYYAGSSRTLFACMIYIDNAMPSQTSGRPKNKTACVSWLFTVTMD